MQFISLKTCLVYHFLHFVSIHYVNLFIYSIKYNGTFKIFPSNFKLFKENLIDMSLLNLSLYLVKLVLLTDFQDFTSIGIILFLFCITKSISHLSNVK